MTFDQDCIYSGILLKTVNKRPEDFMYLGQIWTESTYKHRACTVNVLTAKEVF